MAVGPKGEVIGVDISDPMLGLAGRRCADLDQVRLVNADVCQLPVDDDIGCCLRAAGLLLREGLDEALSELHRALKPGGRAVILDTDYAGVVWETRDRDRMRRVLNAWDTHAAWPDLPRVLPRRLRAAGFAGARCEAVPMLTLNYHPNTYVHGLAASCTSSSSTMRALLPMRPILGSPSSMPSSRSMPSSLR